MGFYENCHRKPGNVREFFFESPEHSLHGNIGVSVIAEEGINVDMFFS